MLKICRRRLKRTILIVYVLLTSVFVAIKLLPSSSSLSAIYPKTRRFAQDSNPLDEYTLSLSKQEANVKKEILFIDDIGSHPCYKLGISLNESYERGECVCTEEYKGKNCGVPSPVWSVQGNDVGHYCLRSRPRRIIMAMVVNHELELTEVRIRSLHDLVEVFVISEGNVSAGGIRKPLTFFNALRNDEYLEDLQHKILYIFHHEGFPEGYIDDGWMADDYIRTVMSRKTLQRIKGLRDDDLFLSFDADELPKPEVIMFLRWFEYDGDPISMTLRFSVFGFFWQMMQENNSLDEWPTTVHVGSSIKFLRGACKGNVIVVRRYLDQIKVYEGTKKVFPIGTIKHYAGFHCTWCLSADGIRTKLRYAQVADGERWHKHPIKMKTEFIERLISNGHWFDGSNPLKRSNTTKSNYAPRYMMERTGKYSKFLFHPHELANSKIFS